MEEKNYAKSISFWVGLTTIYSGLIVFLNLPLRPAWAWEIEKLNTEQKQFQIEFYQHTKRTLLTELYQNKQLQREMIRTEGTTQEWVLKEEFEISTQLKEIDVKINKMQTDVLNSMK